MFDKIISLENLFDAWTEFKKEKANKNDVAEFEINLEDHIFSLHEDLKNGTYKHSGYVSFFISDPKRRHIHKASVRDRLLHHAVHRIIEPEWNKIFVFDSWSSRKNKGIHAAVKRLQSLGLKLSRNHTRTLWVLKLDVRKFFDSVDHSVLLSILEKRTSDERLMALFRDIIESFSPGLPLGNLTSQLFSNVYLDKLDQFVKHELKIIGYIRYADDFILIHPSRELLVDCLQKIKVFLSENLRLDVHLKKIVLKTYTGGIDYLGYVCFPHHRVLRTKTKRRMFRRASDKNFTSYNGILQHCRSRNLQAKLLERVNKKDGKRTESGVEKKISQTKSPPRVSGVSARRMSFPIRPFEGFTVQNQKLTPIWTSVFDVLMDLQASNFELPKGRSKGTKTLTIPSVQSCQSGGVSRSRTFLSETA